jgi:hypothetical protein
MGLSPERERDLRKARAWVEIERALAEEAEQAAKAVEQDRRAFVNGAALGRLLKWHSIWREQEIERQGVERYGSVDWERLLAPLEIEPEALRGLLAQPNAARVAALNATAKDLQQRIEADRKTVEQAKLARQQARAFLRDTD